MARMTPGDELKLSLDPVGQRAYGKPWEGLGQVLRIADSEVALMMQGGNVPLEITDGYQVRGKVLVRRKRDRCKCLIWIFGAVLVLYIYAFRPLAEGESPPSVDGRVQERLVSVCVFVHRVAYQGELAAVAVSVRGYTRTPMRGETVDHSITLDHNVGEDVPHVVRSLPHAC